MENNKIREKYMRKVFVLAKKALGNTSPNPMVGALLVKNGKIISQGYHKEAGTSHAERIVLDLAGKEAEGADLYLNLEPCSHFGRTPPCVDYVIASKVKRVYISNLDPNPLVNGKSIKKMRDHNIEVFTGMLEEEGYELNEVFFKYITSGIPFVALKSASSMDGKIATSTGESKWITGEKARQDGHKLRKIYDGILVGINTVLEDNPELTCRIRGGQNPIRIILDTSLRISPDSKLLNLEDSLEKTLIFCSSTASKDKVKQIEKKARLLLLEGEEIDLKMVLQKLGELRITSVLIEGGSKIHGSFIKEKLVDKFYFYYAPMLIGGDRAPGFFGGLGVESLLEAPRMRFHSISKVGTDMKVVLYPE